jgi:hypothetical protein
MKHEGGWKYTALACVNFVKELTVISETRSEQNSVSFLIVVMRPLFRTRCFYSTDLTLSLNILETEKTR